MRKQNLIERAKKWEQESKKMPLLGYPRKGQEEITKISVDIIKALCEMEGLTPFRAKWALKMATDIIDEEIQHDAISEIS